jgi:hypothetical protein
VFDLLDAIALSGLVRHHRPAHAHSTALKYGKRSTRRKLQAPVAATKKGGRPWGRATACVT